MTAAVLARRRRAGGGLSRYALGGKSPVQVAATSGNSLIDLNAPITTTRAGSGSYWTSAGALLNAGSNVARVSYDPSGTLSPALLSEQAATQEFDAPGDLQDAAWSGFRISKSDGDDAPVSGEVFTIGEASETNANGANIGTQVLGSAKAAGDYYVDFHFKAAASNNGWALVWIADNSNFSTSYARAWFNPVTGALGAVQSTGGFSSESGVVTAISGGIYRLRLNFTTAASLSIISRLYVVDANSSLSVALGARTQAWGAQFGAQPGYSYTIGDGPITRPADAHTMPLRHGGGDLTICTHFNVAAAPANSSRLISAGVASTGLNDRHLFYWLSGNLRFNSVVGGVARGGTGNLGAVGAGTHKLAFSLSDGAMRASLNGGTVQAITGLSGSLPALDTLTWFRALTGGASPAGTNRLFEPARVFDTALPDAALQEYGA